MKILGDSIALSVCCTDRYRMSSCWASRPHFTKAERTRRKATRVGLFCHYPWLRWLSPVHSLGCHLCFPFSLAQWEWQAPRSVAVRDCQLSLRICAAACSLSTAELTYQRWRRECHAFPTAYCWCSMFLFHSFWFISLCHTLFDVPPKTLEQTCEYTFGRCRYCCLVSKQAGWLWSRRSPDERMES